MASRSGSSPAPRPLALAAGALLVLAGALAPADWEALPDLCLFHRVTGLPCPACGLTRSWSALLHGQLEASFHYHALGGLALALLAAYGAWKVASPRPLPRAAWIAAGGAWTLHAALRMLHRIPYPG